MNWNALSNRDKVNILAGESTVDAGLLVECEPLVKALKSGVDMNGCLKIINENF